MSAVAEADPGTVTPPPAAWERLRAGLLVGLPAGGRFAVSGVTWDEYEHLLAVRNEHRKGVRLTYDDGELEVMSHGSRHERWKSVVAALAHTFALGLRIPVVGVGSVTVRRASRRRGLEPDAGYYIQRAAGVQPIWDRDLDFETDPPPDLAVEVEIRPRSVPRLPVYAALGVPEVWRWDGTSLSVLHLTPAGGYEKAESSLAFPALPPARLAGHLAQVGTTDDTTLCRAMLAWADGVRLVGEDGP